MASFRLSFLFLVFQSLLGIACSTASSNSLEPQVNLDAKWLLNTIFGQPASQLLLLPGSSDYNSEIKQYWNVANQNVTPSVIVRPRTSVEAATAIRVLSLANIPFGIRSGGHTPNPGWNTSPVALIALTNFNTVSFPSNGVASIGAGLRWSAVYKKLGERGVTCLGGRYAQVGVGGYLTGGGLSHLSNEYGYAADMLVNAEVVLSNGLIVNANQTSNPDLFWAIKGGSNNFGLITRFDVKTVAQPSGIWGGMMTIGSENVQRVLQAVADWQKYDQAKDLKAAVLVSLIKGPFVGSPTATLASVTLYYGAHVAKPDVLKRFWEIPALTSSLRFTTHSELAEELATGDNHNKRHLFYTGTYKASASMNIQAHDMYMAALDKISLFRDSTSYTAFTLQPISKSMLSIGEGSRAIGGLPAKDGPYIWYSIHIEWTADSISAKVEKFAQDIQKELQKTAKGVTGASVDYQFLNDAGATQDPLRNYGTDNYAKMKKIAKKYDPTGSFSNNCGGFKLLG